MVGGFYGAPIRPWKLGTGGCSELVVGGNQVKSGSGKCRLSWYDPGHAKQKGLKGILIE